MKILKIYMIIFEKVAIIRLRILTKIRFNAQDVFVKEFIL